MVIANIQPVTESELKVAFIPDDPPDAYGEVNILTPEGLGDKGVGKV